MKKYIITGGPCTGKTTLIDCLSEYGYTVIPEAARHVISEEQEKENYIKNYSGILPWKCLDKFQYRVLETQIRFENEAIADIAFLDRSIIDILAYLPALEDQLMPHIQKANYTKVFFLEQLPFYQKDSQRKESVQEAKIAHKQVYEAYKRTSLEIIKVPNLGIEKRVDFVLNHLNGGETNGRMLQERILQQQL
jgi:predicted ATPase